MLTFRFSVINSFCLANQQLFVLQKTLQNCYRHALFFLAKDAQQGTSRLVTWLCPDPLGCLQRCPRPLATLSGGTSGRGKERNGEGKGKRQKKGKRRKMGRMEDKNGGEGKSVAEQDGNGLCSSKNSLKSPGPAPSLTLTQIDALVDLYSTSFTVINGLLIHNV